MTDERHVSLRVIDENPARDSAHSKEEKKKHRGAKNVNKKTKARDQT